MKIVAATGNKKKLEEIRAILSDIKEIELLSLNDFPDIGEIEETETTFSGNALIKARAVHKSTGHAALSDDSGLVVDALDGRPGVFSARYGGPGASDSDKCGKIILEMESITENRTARFVCAIAIVLPDGREFIAEGFVEGAITREPAGTNGFGYDPIFFVKNKNKTMAELTNEEKNRISHRASALKQAVEIIKSL